MKKLIQKKIKTKEGNYRIEKYKSDKYGDIACVEVSCYFNNNVDVSGLTSLGSVMRHLNGKLGRLKMLLKKEYELDIQLVWCDVSDNIMTSNYSFGVVGIQFNMEGISHHLDELVYDVLSDNLIELIEDCKLDVVDK